VSIAAPVDVTNASRPWPVVPAASLMRTPRDHNTVFIEVGTGFSAVKPIEFYGSSSVAFARPNSIGATSHYAFAAQTAILPTTSGTPGRITALSPSHNSPASSKPSPDQTEQPGMKFVSMDNMPIGDLLAGDDTPMPDHFDMLLGGNNEGSFTVSDTFLQRDILDRHINSYFENVHALLPILHEGAFRKLYGVFWEEVERRETSKDQMQIGRDALDAGVMPLVCAVACHGALYSSEDDNDQREWARGYFVRARRSLSVFENGSFETMIAMYLLV
jgi:hypothetical protein